MSYEPGTLENMLDQFVFILQPMKDLVNASGSNALFSELGISIPLSNQDAIELPVISAITDITALKTLIQDLLQALDEENYDAVLEKAIAGIEKIKDFINTLGTIAEVIRSFNLPDLPVADIDSLPKKILDYLVASYTGKIDSLNNALLFTGILDIKFPDDISLPSVYTFHYDKVIDWISDPGAQLNLLYNWGSANFDGKLLFKKIQQIVSLTGLPVIYDDTLSPAALDLILFIMTAVSVNGKTGISVKLKTTLPVGNVSFENDIFTSALSMDFQAGMNTTLQILQDGSISLLPPVPGMTYSGNVQLDMKTKTGPGVQPVFSMGEQSAGLLEIAEINLSTGAQINWDGTKGTGNFSITADIKNGKLSIDTTNSDGFLSSVLPAKKMEAVFDISAGISNGKFYFTGSSALEVSMPAHISLGPVSIEGITIAVIPDGGKIPIELGADISVVLGPLAVVIQNIGLSAAFSFPADNTGNLGPLQLDLGFQPPDGAGISVSAGGITGGGFLKYDPVAKEYTGALDLEFQDLFSLKAFGIISTQMPDGSDGFSMLIVITAEFTPVQLGFGFTLNGVGGLLGLNRTTNVEVLRQGIKTNSIQSILFPQNVIANITRIISDIKQVFPPVEGHFLICPMGKIGWGTPALVTLELGLLIEIPSSGFKILGILKALLPEEDDALLKLQVNFLGEIDFDNKSISFIATLYDSKLLTLTLTGDMAFRILFGDSPLFLLSVGGFHPSFTQVPADLKDMKRLSISLYDGSSANISLQSYFAVTSNTVQFGANAQLLAGSKSGFNIYGQVSYDVLFQFSPFHFDADLSGAVQLRHSSSVIMGIKVTAALSGPSPWDAKGEASVSFFFFSISVPFHVSWGSADNGPAKELADIIVLLTAQIADSSNWKAALPSGSSLHVTIKKIDAQADTTVVHPFGVLSFSERLVPLGIAITRFGNDTPKGVSPFTIIPSGTSLSWVPLTEEFAPANFFDFSDAEKLSRPSFEPMTSGFSITGSSQLQVSGNTIIKKVAYELSYPGKPVKGKFYFPGSIFQAYTKLAAASQSSLSHLNNRASLNAPSAVMVAAEQYSLAGTADMKPFGNTGPLGSYTEALQQYNNLVKTNPALKSQLQIVSHSELNLN